jgi:AraC family carnitine catabolism transcriptional activator
MAKYGGVSRRALERYFQRTHHTSPKQWCIAQRMAQAEVLLVTRRKSVKEIAAALEFQSVSHFCQAFRRAYGASPHAYAVQHRPKTPRFGHSLRLPN